MTSDESVPTFLTADEVSRIHQDQLDRYGGGTGSPQLDRLFSAVAQPQATFGGQFLHRDVFEMTAVFSISRRTTRSLMATSGLASLRPQSFLQ